MKFEAKYLSKVVYKTYQICIITNRLDLRLVNLRYAHTNGLCVVQENVKPKVIKVQTELARSEHYFNPFKVGDHTGNIFPD